MKKLLPALVLVVIVLCSVSHAAGVKKRAVSLKMLQQALKAGDSAQAKQLCGITRISGYLVDGQNKDIILIGQVDPSYPTLYADDFVVALRNVWRVYAKKKGNTLYYTPPGCSIDPNPKILQMLQETSNRIAATDDIDKKREGFEDWQAIGRQPQKVRVLGVPFDSRFAKVMVDADFYMKRLSNGTVTLPIENFRSMMDMRIIRTESARENGELAPENSLNRFWFCPGESTFSEDEGVITLESCKVRLLTEQEFLDNDGQVSGTGKSDPLARDWANSFTANYQAIADERPVYKDLEGLFRFVALANLMKDENAFSEAKLDPGYLVKNHRVAVTPVSRAVQGLTCVREMTSEKEVEGGTLNSTYWYMTCGGVSMDVHPKKIKRAVSKPTPPAPKANQPASTKVAKSGSTLKPAPARTPTLKKKVLEARKSTKSLYWDLPE